MTIECNATMGDVLDDLKGAVANVLVKPAVEEASAQAAKVAAPVLASAKTQMREEIDRALMLAGIMAVTLLVAWYLLSKNLKGRRSR